MHTFIGLVCEWCGEMMMVAAMAARLSLYPLLSQVAYLKTSKSCEKLLRINTSPSQPPKQTHCAAHRNQHFNSRFFKKLIIVFESHSFGPPERLLQKLCCFSRARWIFRLFVCVFCVFFLSPLPIGLDSRWAPIKRCWRWKMNDFCSSFSSFWK